MPRGVPGSIADHGTSARYMRGCRCDDCRKAGHAYFAARRRAEGRQTWEEYQASRPRSQHGTEAMYTRHKCRCDECRTAANLARRQRRLRDLEKANRYDRDYKWLTRYG